MIKKNSEPERLLSIDQVARRLMLSRRTIIRKLPVLQAKGLQKVSMGGRSVRFRESSLDYMIKRAAERSEPLF